MSLEWARERTLAWEGSQGELRGSSRATRARAQPRHGNATVAQALVAPARAHATLFARVWFASRVKTAFGRCGCYCEQRPYPGSSKAVFLPRASDRKVTGPLRRSSGRAHARRCASELSLAASPASHRSPVRCVARAFARPRSLRHIRSRALCDRAASTPRQRDARTGNTLRQHSRGTLPGTRAPERSLRQGTIDQMCVATPSVSSSTSRPSCPSCDQLSVLTPSRSTAEGGST